MKYKQYQKYKDSGIEWIGEIPEHWEIKRLKFVLEDRISDGPHETPEFVDVGIPFLSVDNIQDDKLYLENLRYISKVDHERFSLKCKPKKNDILLGKAASVGKVALVDLDLDFNIWSPLAVIRVSQNKMSPQFTYFLMKSDFLQTQISLKVNWNTQGNIGMGDIKNLFILQPPYDEQKQIYHFLNTQTNQFDGIILKSQSQIKLLQEKRQTTIDQSVTKGLDPTVPMKDSSIEWIGEIPEHWEVKPLKFLAKIERGQFTHRPRNDPAFYGGIHPFIQTGDIEKSNVYITNYKQTLNEKGFAVSKLFSKNVIVMSIAANIGSTAITTFDICFPDSIVGITTTVLDVLFLRFFFLSIKSHLEEIATITTQKNINYEFLKRLPIPTPAKKESKQISEFLYVQTKQFDNLISKSQSQINFLQEKRQALITAAVTGKIDVRNGVAA